MLWKENWLFFILWIKYENNLIIIFFLFENHLLQVSTWKPWRWLKKKTLSHNHHYLNERHCFSCRMMGCKHRTCEGLHTRRKEFEMEVMCLDSALKRKESVLLSNVWFIVNIKERKKERENKTIKKTRNNYNCKEIWRG